MHFAYLQVVRQNINLSHTRYIIIITTIKKETSYMKQSLRNFRFWVLSAMMMVASGNAVGQGVTLYDYSTGVESSQWVDLGYGGTQLIGSGQDDRASSVTNIGFSFSFAGTSYSQFSVNSNGVLRFGSTVPGVQNHAATLSTAVSNFVPLINGCGADIATGNNGYIKYQLTGTAPYRCLVVEYYMIRYFNGFQNTNSCVKWQVQLFETTNEIQLVYGPSTATTNVPTSFQVGMASSASDIVGVATATSSVSTGSVAASAVWPDAYRYYRFTPPSTYCPQVTMPSCTQITQTSGRVSWSPGGSESQWLVEYGTGSYGTGVRQIANTSSVNITGLSPATTYNVYIRAICGASDTSAAPGTRTSFTTACGPVTQFPIKESFVSWTAGASAAARDCWYKACTYRYSNYPYVYNSTSYAADG